MATCAASQDREGVAHVLVGAEDGVHQGGLRGSRGGAQPLEARGLVRESGAQVGPRVE